MLYQKCRSAQSLRSCRRVRLRLGVRASSPNGLTENLEMKAVEVFTFDKSEIPDVAEQHPCLQYKLITRLDVDQERGNKLCPLVVANH